MRFDLAFYLFADVLLILLFVLPRWLWHVGKATPVASKPARPKREPKPFAGILASRSASSVIQPWTLIRRLQTRISFTRGRRRQVDTTGHFYPQAACSYHGWVDWGNIRANSHPNGRRWRQLVCLGCHGYFLETVGTPVHAKQVDPDKLVWTITALAEGLGIRGVARVFKTDPNTVLG